MDDKQVWTWIRWDDPDDRDDNTNKWHLRDSDLQAWDETVCGLKVPDDIVASEFVSEFDPVDEHGVCLHCIRYRELKNREAE